MALTVLRARLGRCAAVAGLLCYASAASADIPAPDKPLPAPPAQRSAPLPLTVEEDATTPVHRIVIPKAVLAKLAANQPDGRGDYPGGQVGAASPTRSIVAALALSAAVACGLVVARRGRPGRLAAGLIIGLVTAGAAGLLPGTTTLADRAAANAPPPRAESRPAADRPESVVIAQGAKVILEIAEGGAEAVVIFVGKPQAANARIENQLHSTPPPGRGR